MKSALLAAAIFLSLGTCRAEVLQFRFQFTGFVNPLADEAWEPLAKVSGYFAGEDRNGDFNIDRSELLAFTLNGQSYFGCSGEHFCNVSYFSYRPLDVVRFQASSGSYIPHIYYSSTHFQSVDFRQPFEEYISDEVDYPLLRATLQTTYSIMPGVPEPTSVGMLAAGLAMIGRRLYKTPRREAAIGWDRSG